MGALRCSADKRRPGLARGRKYVGTGIGKDTKILLDARRTVFFSGGKTSSSFQPE